MRLSRRDLESALAFVREAGELDECDPFPPHLLRPLASLVNSRGVSYCEIDRTRNEITFSASTSAGDVPDEAYWQTVHEHPIRNHRKRTGDTRALKIYDFMTPTQLRRTQFYADFIRPWATPYMMTLSLPAPPTRTRTFIFDRERSDFGERARALLNLLQPHLVQIKRATDERSRARVRVATTPDGVLTEREVEILSHVAHGLRNREIAAALWISPGTVRRHLDNIYGKLNAHTRAAAVRIARERALPLTDRHG